MADWQARLALTAQRNRREIVEAKLCRRDMVKLGLLTTAGTLVLKRGLSVRAERGGGQPSSPPTTPFVTQLPLPIVKSSKPKLSPEPSQSFHKPTEAARDNFQAFGHGPNQYLPKQFFEVSVHEAQHRFDPKLPPNTIWGFDGQFPGPLIVARYGTPTILRIHNNLPKNHVGFGMPEISTHLHNAHSGPESDGYPQDFYTTGLYKDHFYPNQYAGFSTLKLGSNGSSVADGDPNEALGFLWYHDHRVMFTAQNVYKGLAGLYTLFDDVDTGNENDTRSSALRLPGNDPTDPNRQFDIPLAFTDKVFDADGQQIFDMFNTDGILGDKFLVNGKIQPFFPVARRKYRFRLLNMGPSRFYEFFLSNGQSFLQISNDGNLLPRPIMRQSVRLGVAERAEIIVDFASASKGDQIFLQNRLEQTNGRGPSGQILASGDDLLRFDVILNAADSPPIPTMLRVLPPINMNQVAQTRNWEFDRRNGAWEINGQPFSDKKRASPQLGTSEIWTLKNAGGGWSHPIHIHHEEFRILTRNGLQPPPHEVARKDVATLGPGEEVTILRKFRDFTGRYPMHCHNVVHEDHAMMLRWDIEAPAS